MKEFFRDGVEWSMRRLIAFWAMSLMTVLICGLMSGKTIDTQVFFIVGGIATVSVGSAMVKAKPKI
jgi:hypothetical protein